MSNKHLARACKLALFVSALAGVLQLAPSASAQGTTHIASTPHERIFPSTTPATPATFRVHSLVLHASDPAQVARWYVDHLGFKVARHDSKVTSIYLDQLTIDVERADADARAHLVLSVRDLPRQLQVLRKAGVDSRALGSHAAQLRDPAGNLIELTDAGS